MSIPSAQNPSVAIPISQEMAQSVSRFMNQVYRWMILGIFVTALTACVTSHYMFDVIWYLHHQDNGYETFKIIFKSLIGLQLVLVFGFALFARRMRAWMAMAAYLVYAFVTGLTTSFIFYVFTRSDISSAFFITMAAFVGLAAFGYVTKKDLRFIGTFCIMGCFGLLGVFLYAMFDPSFMTNTAVFYTGIAGIVIFSGLTAYDSQRIRQLGVQLIQEQQKNVPQQTDQAAVLAKIVNIHKTDELSAKIAIIGALALYLDFINLFFSVLRVMKK